MAQVDQPVFDLLNHRRRMLSVCVPLNARYQLLPNLRIWRLSQKSLNRWRHLSFGQQEIGNRARIALSLRCIARQTAVAPEPQPADAVAKGGTLFDANTGRRQKAKPNYAVAIALLVRPSVANRFADIAGSKRDIAPDVLDLSGLGSKIANAIEVLSAL
jgi:hypothetical protein